MMRFWIMNCYDMTNATRNAFKTRTWIKRFIFWYTCTFTCISRNMFQNGRFSRFLRLGEIWSFVTLTHSKRVANFASFSSLVWMTFLRFSLWEIIHVCGPLPPRWLPLSFAKTILIHFLFWTQILLVSCSLYVTLALQLAHICYSLAMENKMLENIRILFKCR